MIFILAEGKSRFNRNLCCRLLPLWNILAEGKSRFNRNACSVINSLNEILAEGKSRFNRNPRDGRVRQMVNFSRREISVQPQPAPSAILHCAYFSRREISVQPQRTLSRTGHFRILAEGKSRFNRNQNGARF